MTDLQICLFALGNCMAGMMIALAWLSQNRLGVTLAHGFFIIMWAVVFGFGGVDPLRAEEARGHGQFHAGTNRSPTLLLHRNIRCKSPFQIRKCNGTFTCSARHAAKGTV